MKTNVISTSTQNLRLHFKMVVRNSVFEALLLFRKMAVRKMPVLSSLFNAISFHGYHNNQQIVRKTLVGVAIPRCALRQVPPSPETFLYIGIVFLELDDNDVNIVKQEK